MKMEGLHEKELFTEKFPFRVLMNQNVDFYYPAHWHNAMEIIYVMENPFVVFANSQRYLLRENDIIIIPGGDVHEFKSEEVTGTRVFINFELSFLNNYENQSLILSRLHDVRQIRPEDGEFYKEIKSVIQQMMCIEQTPLFTNQLYVMARVIDLILCLCKSSTFAMRMDDDNKKLVGLKKINKSFEYIEQNYSENIHLKDIAQHAGFSLYYFSRLFKETTEKNFHQYLNEYRLKKAEALLMDSNYSISEAAYAVGFNSVATFDRLFHQLKGCSPQKFRKLKVN